MAPALFISHGSPMNAIEENEFTQSLQKIGKEILSRYKIEAIICISAHWITKGTCITSNQELPTIHDFWGFPEELYKIDYPAKGNPILAKKMAEELHLLVTEEWGLDHGSWTVLKWLLPEPNLYIPILQLSIDLQKSFKEHFDFAKTLSEYKYKNILFLCSGNVTHNLSLVDFYHINAEPDVWVKKFDDFIKQVFLNKEYDKLIQIYENPLYKIAHPEPSHFIPLLYFAGLDTNNQIRFFYEGFHYRTLSMRSMILL
jgi:4,5-DOPA dioxygenase extradiol